MVPLCSRPRMGASFAVMMMGRTARTASEQSGRNSGAFGASLGLLLLLRAVLAGGPLNPRCEKRLFHRLFPHVTAVGELAQQMRAERMAQLDILVGRARVLYLKPRTDRLKAGRRA